MNKRIAHIFVLNVILIASQGEAGLDSSYEQPPQLNLSGAQRKELEDIDLPQDFISEITEQIDDMSAKIQQNRRKRYFQDHEEEIHLENGLSNSSSSNSSKKGRKMVYEMKDDSEYVSENLYFRPIKILQIPLSFENILAFVVIVALAALGNIYLWKLFSKQRCSCKLCEGVYELGEKIGDGGFSSVYMAFKQRTNQQFVLKRIEMRDITEVDEVQFEAKQLIPLSHMNIVSYEDDFIHHDFTTLDTKFSYILIMEYWNGGDLTDKIRAACEADKPFSENQLMEYFCQLCLAVKYIHSRDVIHRDIKSPNLFLSDEHYLKLGDFGLSTKGRSVRDKSCISRVGTDWYMAPEVRDGSYVDKDSMKTGRKSRKNLYLNLKPSDIWCIGLILFEMVTLIPVWELKFDITLKLISDPDEVWKLVDDLTYYDSQVTSIIKKCLKIDAKDRPTIHQILKGKFVKKHLKYLEKNKKKYKKNESMKLLEEGQIWSRQASSDDSYFGSDNNDESDISVYLEDQGSLLEPKNPRKQTRRRKKNKKKRSR